MFYPCQHSATTTRQSARSQECSLPTGWAHAINELGHQAVAIAVPQQLSQGVESIRDPILCVNGEIEPDEHHGDRVGDDHRFASTAAHE